MQGHMGHLKTQIPKFLAKLKSKSLKLRGPVSKGPLAKLTAPISKAAGALKKEATLSPTLHEQVLGALRSMQAKDRGLEKVLKKAYAYAVFPAVGKASVLLGGAYGLGEVFEHGRVIGYSAIVQLTVGVQLGGQTFHELVVLDSRQALDEFKRGKVAFAANASAVIVKAGAAATSSRTGTRAYVLSEGGLMAEAAIGGQKFIFKPALLGRTKTASKPSMPGPSVPGRPHHGEETGPSGAPPGGQPHSH